ncbi:competence type IV pilus assembly protein ComGB [Natronobacillus azotifigens]|uniref:Competence type IV pilus assembly protein ComGB n=1 Tax=Natronobacillus azotifigens TaxID=472978 RepID=A0A9J6RF52_9BACI|nr:competence type IV pilus assembly protein ComGB [Natronobacillus azotifigens]MCZ0704069.1 competence type IV pilus assembly protein ComGB [Natronobacillus azotifigens]
MVSLNKWNIRNKKKQPHPLSLLEQSLFLKKLNRLLSQHYPLLEALRALQWNPKWKKTAIKMISSLKEGESFEVVLANLYFDKKIVSFVYFSLLHGNIREALQHSSELIDQQLFLIKKFEKIMRYPLVLLSIFLTLLYFVRTQVYPAFSQLFSTTTYTSVYRNVAIFIIDLIFNSLIILGLGIGLFLIIWFLCQKKFSTVQKIALYQRTPLIRYYVRANQTFLFSLHLSSLLKAGLSLKECIQFLKKQSELPILAHYSSYILEQLEDGCNVTSALPPCTLLDPDLRIIFQSDMNQKSLIMDLRMYAEYLLESVQAKLEKAMTLIQPIFFLFIAVSIIFIYLSILIPMFQLIQHI